MKILFDTNIILDVMLLREPFYRVASFLLAAVERKTIEGYICSITVTTIHYLVTKVKGSKVAKQQIENILQIFQIAPVDKIILEKALHSRINDYEDAVIHEAAVGIGAEGIVTRDPKDFRYSKLSVFDPEELIKLLLSIED